MSRNLKVFAYANNHYAGHSPGTVKLFWELYEKRTAQSMVKEHGEGSESDNWDELVRLPDLSEVNKTKSDIANKFRLRDTGE